MSKLLRYLSLHRLVFLQRYDKHLIITLIYWCSPTAWDLRSLSSILTGLLYYGIKIRKTNIHRYQKLPTISIVFLVSENFSFLYCVNLINTHSNTHTQTHLHSLTHKHIYTLSHTNTFTQTHTSTHTFSHLDTFPSLINWQGVVRSQSKYQQPSHTYLAT